MCCVTSHLYFTVLMSAFRNTVRLIVKLMLDLEYPRLVLGNLAAFTHGSCVVYPSEIFDPAKIVDALLAEKCVETSPGPTANVIPAPTNRMNVEFSLTGARRCTASRLTSSVCYPKWSVEETEGKSWTSVDFAPGSRPGRLYPSTS
jgi:hypothetical protein